MVTPGYWDDHYELFDEEDFFSLRARFNPDYRKPHFPSGTTLLPHASSSFLIGTGFYRKQIGLDLAGERVPQRWSDREPKLYTVRFELFSGDVPTDFREQKWGADN